MKKTNLFFGLTAFAFIGALVGQQSYQQSSAFYINYPYPDVFLVRNEYADDTKTVLMYRTTNTYTSSGLIETVIDQVADESGKQVNNSKMEFEYNSKGQQTKVLYYYAEGENHEFVLSYYNVYEFNDKNLMSSYTTYMNEEEGPVEAYKETYTYNDKGLRIGFKHYDDKLLTYSATSEYDDNSNEILASYEMTSGTRCTYEYTYDQNHNITSCTYTDYDDKSLVNVIYDYLYEYDEQNRLTYNVSIYYEGDRDRVTSSYIEAITYDGDKKTSDCGKLGAEGKPIFTSRIVVVKNKNLFSETHYNYQEDRLVYTESESFDYKYDSNGNNTSIARYQTDEQGQHVKSLAYFEYEYPAPTPTPTPEKKGCGSSIIASAVVVSIVSLVGISFVSLKKKEN